MTNASSVGDGCGAGSKTVLRILQAVPPSRTNRPDITAQQLLITVAFSGSHTDTLSQLLQSQISY
jgi:hypothetical protein